MDQTAKRKSNHVDIVLNENVDYQKSTGFEKYTFVHNALPEINYDEIDIGTEFFSYKFSAPIIVSSMTGGFKRGGSINAALAEFCREKNIGMGVGSQRQALDNDEYLETFKVVRRTAKNIFVMSNIGAAQIAGGFALDNARRIVDMVEANAIAVHLNALQEMIQPEGDRNFRGVVKGISELVKKIGMPVIVKETGAGIGGEAAKKLIDNGVAAIDVSGAGGTSWSAIETLRRTDRRIGKSFWNWGIPTAEALVQVNALSSRKKIKLISSGGIRNGINVAKSIALGADICSAAQPFLKALDKAGVKGLMREFDAWVDELKGVMFLTGSVNLRQLNKVKLEKA
ncbi:MAG TPA: type 2 isopentenyl-diphosphate Delta-isomerase [Candidatus Acidoferrales bacterium]|nr:type 2 isopentenyl-diphosphate Delta-isomerase [Candidatus Acidoferrales bacterium]